MVKSFRLAGPIAIAEALDAAGTWVVVIFANQSIERGIKRIRRELILLLDDKGETADVRVITAPVEANKLVAMLRSQSQCAALVVRGLEAMTDGELQVLDRRRNALIAAPRLLIATTSDGARKLGANPNFWGWVGGECFEFDPQEGAMGVKDRLDSIREGNPTWSDERVVEAAKNGTLPADPVFGEWLVLLEEGGLLAS